METAHPLEDADKAAGLVEYIQFQDPSLVVRVMSLLTPTQQVELNLFTEPELREMIAHHTDEICEQNAWLQSKIDKMPSQKTCRDHNESRRN